MPKMKIRFFLFFLILGQILYCQNIKIDSLHIKEKRLINYKPLAIPAFLIGCGVFSIKDKDERQEIVVANYRELLNKPQKSFILDDIAQYTPTISVFALNAMGIKGKHNFLDLTIILGTAYLITGVTVKSIKRTSNIQRPDATSFNAFPSGHTASAFMGAEFLYQEYKNESIWYGVTGYAIATATAYSRVKNKRHWVSDVFAGAGIGILSTKAAYWLHPIFKRVFFKKEGKINGMAVPYLNKDTYGLAMSFSF